MGKNVPNKRVAAVVVTYNRKALLVECLDNLRNQTRNGDQDIIVIDNASTDGTGELLAGYQDVIYINTGANLGGAGGFQRGFREAAERGYEFAWVMDDDCMPTPTALEELLKHADGFGDDYGYLSSKVLWKDGSICEMNVQRERLIHDVDVAALPDDACKQIDMASFVSLFVPTRVVWELGLPIKEFFIWTDDWEYTRRISRKYPCYLVPSSVVIHKSARNIGANVATESVDRLGRFRTMYRNDVVLYRREGTKGFFYEVARLAGHAVRVIAHAPNHKKERLSSIFGGTREGFRFHPQIEFPTKG